MRIVNDLDLTQYNSYRLKSIAKNAFFPETIDDLKKIIDNYDNLVILGGGNNTIFSKEYYANENFVFIRGNFSGISLINDTTLHALAGTDMKTLSEEALKHSLTGLEYFYDIPGCVGGGVAMNAGAKGEFLGDYIIEVECMDIRTGSRCKFSKEDLFYSYRDSIFQHEPFYVIISATFSLQKADYNAIKRKMEENYIDRNKKQPRDFPNAGSVFKRPEGHYVGPMVTECGLKGYSIGGAMVSTKHAGFIVNYNNATSKDILSLIEKVRSEVSKKFGVELVVEQRLI